MSLILDRFKHPSTLISSSRAANIILLILLVNMLNLTAVAQAQGDSFWHIHIANYIDNAKATQELGRLEALGYQGEIEEVIENESKFHQLRIGCFLNEATAKTYLKLLNNQLIYPSLSMIAKSDSPATSFCLGLEVGIELPQQWEIIRDDDILLLSITILDYVRLIGFNGDVWTTFKTEDDIPEDWQATSQSESELACKPMLGETLNCEIANYSFSLSIVNPVEPAKPSSDAELSWQNGNSLILKVGNSLKVLRVVEF